MKWKLFCGLAILALLAGIGGAELQLRWASPAVAKDDPLYKEYVQSLFLVPGKAQEEFERLATASPLLTSYAMALFTKNRCSTPPASDALIKAAGGTDAFTTEAGERVFAVVGVVATMTYPSAEAEARFCESAKRFIQTGEKYVSEHGR